MAAYYTSRFGVPASILSELRMESRNEEIWATTGHALPGIHSVRSMGLRIGRAFPQGFKPTSVFLRALGEHIVRARVPVTREQLAQLLLGRRIPWEDPDEGYVALDHAGDVVGCGRIYRGQLQALLPTGRRRELLEILSASS